MVAGERSGERGARSVWAAGHYPLHATCYRLHCPVTHFELIH